MMKIEEILLLISQSFCRGGWEVLHQDDSTRSDRFNGIEQQQLCSQNVRKSYYIYIMQTLSFTVVIVRSATADSGHTLLQFAANFK
jgi:hypothetical protein